MICYLHAFAGSITPVEDEQSIYTIEVINGGSVTQTNYSVKLMMEGGIELASIPGESIGFTEKIIYELPWTPGDANIGTTSVYAVIELAGDEIPENNQTKQVSIVVQPEHIESVEIGSDNIALEWLPYNFFNLHSMSQTLYFPDEIGVSHTPITGILYTCQFDEDVQVPIQIWLGETDRNDLNETWVDPATLTPVFNGTVSFSKGMNPVYIPFDNAYTYTDRNLVIYSYKSYTEMVLGTPFISSYDTNSMRSRLAESDEAFDPMNPTWGYNSDYYPNITLLHSTLGTSVNQEEVSNTFMLFPNPAKNLLYLVSDETIKEIRMMDILGQVVYQGTGGSRQDEINVGDYKPGIYLVQVITSNGMTTKKVQVTE
jgi:hypothetical protein